MVPDSPEMAPCTRVAGAECWMPWKGDDCRATAILHSHRRAPRATSGRNPRELDVPTFRTTPYRYHPSLGRNVSELRTASHPSLMSQAKGVHRSAKVDCQDVRRPEGRRGLTTTVSKLCVRSFGHQDLALIPYARPLAQCEACRDASCTCSGTRRTRREVQVDVPPRQLQPEAEAEALETRGR